MESDLHCRAHVEVSPSPTRYLSLDRKYNYKHMSKSYESMSSMNFVDLHIGKPLSHPPAAADIRPRPCGRSDRGDVDPSINPIFCLTRRDVV